MGKGIPVPLGNESFSKKSEVENRIRAMINSYDVMDFIKGTDKDLCLALFTHHPRSAEKIGNGIDPIQVRLDEYGKRNFHLHRTDGSDEVISWPKCLSAIK